MSIGTIELVIHFEKFSLIHEVHVVPDEFAIPVSGILGKDFLKNFQCNIDYATMTLTITVNNDIVTLNIWEGPEENTIVIPPRCEVIRHFKTKKTLTEDQVIDSIEIIPGVYIAKSIFNPNSAFLRVMNTTNETKILKNTLPKTQNLSHFDVYAVDHVESNESRAQNIKEIVGKGVPKYVRDDLENLCTKYADIFAMENDKMTVNNFYQQKLRIVDNDPVYSKNYRLPQSHKAEINRQVNKLLENDLIEPSCSNYNSPLILVPKPVLNGEKRWRMCVDYRLINKKLIADKYPLPRIDEILDGLGRAKYFSIIDLFQGFHQVPLEKDSRDITSFSTTDGSFRWKVLPFGLNVSPNSFSRMMNLAFAGASQVQFFLYMDDIVVIGNSVSHHFKNLESVFQICRKRNLKLNPHKCKFFRPEVTYLGHRCTADGITPDPSKLHCVRNYPTPHDKDSTKRFVAFANYYRRFIQNFSKIARPLNVQTRKKIEFKWTSQCQEAFDELKSCLLSPPVLAYPDFSKPFIITTDASKYSCGAVLSQMINGEDRPIAFASKPFSKGESNKIVMEQELLAIHWAIKHFRPYVYDSFFTVNSDHRSLVYLFSLKDPSSKLTRIRLDLEEHNFEIVHIKGKSNVVADALSRIHIDELKSINYFSHQILAITRSKAKQQMSETMKSEEATKNIIEPTFYETLNGTKPTNIPRLVTEIMDDRALLCVYKHRNKVNRPIIQIDVSDTSNVRMSLEIILSRLQREAARLDVKELHLYSTDIIFKFFEVHEIQQVATKILKNLKIIVTQPSKKVDDPEERKFLLDKFHNDLLVGGHPGQKRLYSKLRRSYHWKNMAKDVAIFVKSCDKCFLNKVKIGTREPLCLTKTPQKPFEKIVIDTIGPLEMSESGNQYSVTMICDLTKYVITGSVPNKEAKTVARAIMNNLILIYGIPREILTDLGTEYKNSILAELTEMLKISHSFATPHRHQTVGSIERNHRSFNEYLRIYLPNSGPTWDEFLKYFTFTYNTTPNVNFDLKYSPYELIFSKTPCVLDVLTPNVIDPVYNIDNFAVEAKFRLQLAHAHAQDLLLISKIRNKAHYDKNIKPINVTPGDEVLITNDGRRKFEPVHKGPFIVERVEEHNVLVKDPKSNKTKMIHKNRLRIK